MKNSKKITENISKNIFGLGLRHKHHNFVLENLPKVDFFEVHTENFIAKGGASINFLEQISQNYPLSFHCVGLSLGSSHKPSKTHLKNIKNLVDKFKPIFLSDHLSWSTNSKTTANDLLPLPYTKESLEIFCQNVDFVQNFLGREILIENPSAYLEFENNQFSETEFINLISQRTNCGLLLDINNIYVSAKNFDFDAQKYLQEIDHEKVKEVHLAGHSIYKIGDQEIRIDTHSKEISKEVLELYQNFAAKLKTKIATLVEWDEEIPEFEVLYNEMVKARGF